MATATRSEKKSQPALLDQVKRITSQQFLYVILLVAVFSVGYLLARVQSLEEGQKPSTAVVADTTDPNQPAAKVAVEVGDLPPLGEKDAPVTLIEFSDMQCPFCRSYYTGAYQQIKKDYVDTGKVAIYFRHYPLSFHAAAQKSGEALECANDQDNFWQLHDLMFDKQQALDPSGGTVDYTTDDIKTWASELGIDMGSFNQCLDSGKYADKVASDTADGTAAGVSGTPAFFVNGTPLVGAQPYESFKAIIDQELAE
ncbi:MAG TPA: thioredoxin domain-containing protein [Candidatus Levybacteria bacterium]|nr:thioredoxin domain-containing protein [Candidatus Levybacteria bacterium]